MNTRQAGLWAPLAALGLLAGGIAGDPLMASEGLTPQAPADTTAWAAEVEASGNLYYVRPDGGSRLQCTGLVDAPYPGSGTARPCAWDHPFRALPPGGPPAISGGDTLLLATGSYQMGYGAPGTERCHQAYSYDCHMPPLPSGPDPAHPTRLLGQGWETGCQHPVELWGSGRPWFVINLTETRHAELACLEITDHSGCVEFHTGNLRCNRDSAPFGDWASVGLYAEDSANVNLRDLNIHGLASSGVHAGRLTDWTVERVRIAGNGWVGWDGDLWDAQGDANQGTLTFRHWTVEWNGCGETYPGGQPVGCWGQEAGGYGDGVGTGATGGDWIIEDSSFLHNTSDGLDLLYHTLGGQITLNRVRAEGNAGNQVKVTGQTQITNSVLVGNCAFFEGAPYSYWVDHCRANGTTLVVVFTGGEQIAILNSSLYGQGDGLIGGEPRTGSRCTGAETISARNSIFLGDRDYFDPSDISFLFYQEGCGALKLASDVNLIDGVKNVACGAANPFVRSGTRDLCQDPLLTGPLSGIAYGMTPDRGSPAIDSADAAICAAPPVSNLDQLGRTRPQDGDGDGIAVCDRGALEHLMFGSHSVTATASAGGSIRPTSVEVPHGMVTTFALAQNAGHHITTVSGCGGTLSGDAYTTAAIVAPCSVRAVFAANPLPKPVQVFADSFEAKTLAPRWTQDEQAAWLVSAQRAKPGRRSAGVDGPARDAALVSLPIDTRGARSATISYSWFNEASLDDNEYLAFDVSLDGGITWIERSRLRANLDPENRWRNIKLVVDLTGKATDAALRLRFRARMSHPVEDANVDNVRVLVQ